MPVTGQWTNPDVLRWARERLNMPIQRAAAESRKLAKRHFVPFSEQELAAWEAGTAGPELAHLETLSEIYVCPVGYFFLDSPPEERLPISFRGLAKPGDQLGWLSQRTLRRFLELAQWTVETLRRSRQPWQVAIRPAQVAPETASTEQLAAEYRQRFGWTAEQRRLLAGDPRRAFMWWRRVVESQGVFCFEMPLDPKEVRGAALWLEGYSFILVNHQDIEASAGRTFTLLHEFAHLISSPGDGIACDFRGSHPNPEPFPNRFAARMLLTPDELMQRLREIGETGTQTDWPDSLLDRLCRHFSVSRDVIAILLQEMQPVPPDFYDRRRQQCESQRPWERGGRCSPLNEQKLQEVGYSLADLLARSASGPSFSWVDAASILGMRVEKVEAFLRWARRYVRRGDGNERV